MPAKAKKAAKKKKLTTGSARRRADLRTIVRPIQKEFCRLMVQEGMSIIEAGREVGLKSDKSGYRWLEMPHVKAYFEKLKAKTEEKMIEKVADKAAEKLALSLELGDSRLAELLNAPRANLAAMFKLKMAQRLKSDNPDKQRLLDEALKELGPTASIDDFVLMKSVELLYKRLGGLALTKPNAPPVSPTAQAVVQVNVSNNPMVPSSGAGVYEPRWVRERYGIVDPESERIEQQFQVAEHISSEPVSSSEADASETLDSAD